LSDCLGGNQFVIDLNYRNGEEACKLYHQHSPDVLVVDLRMPKKDGLQVVEELMSGGPPKPRIIVITTYEDEEDIRRGGESRSKRVPGQNRRLRADRRSGSRSCRWPQRVPDDLTLKAF
jgi:CheY-like chemotaxis protein